MKSASFMVIMMTTDIGQWHGEIHWVERRRREYFRSDLELMGLIGLFIDEEETNENKTKEKNSV